MCKCVLYYCHRVSTQLLLYIVSNHITYHIIIYHINSGNFVIELVPTENNTRISARLVVKYRFSYSYLLSLLSEISLPRGTLRRRYETCTSSWRSLKAHGILFVSALPTSLINLYTLFKCCNLILETL